MGRPNKFDDRTEARVAKLIEKHGLTGAQAVLADQGVQTVPGKPREQVGVSLPTLAKVARNHGITLKRGRRAA